MAQWDNGIVWWQYLAVERAQFSDRHPALDSAAGCSARCRRSEGRRGRPTSQCLRNVGCLHSQPTSSASVHTHVTRIRPAGDMNVTTAAVTAWQVWHITADHHDISLNIWPNKN